MSNLPSPVWSHPEFESRRAVDLLCRQFEEQWRASRPCEIEQFLIQVPPQFREDLLPELVASEWELRAMSGDQPVRSEYSQRFPKLGSLFAQLEAGFCESSVSTTSTESVRTLQVGDEFCGYKVLEVLGQGAMGTVFLAEMPVIGHRVALKILAAGLLQTPAGVLRFEREARLLSRLDHPGIVPLYAYGESNGIRYLVMKAISGSSLSKVIGDKTCEKPTPNLPTHQAGTIPDTIQDRHAEGRFELVMDLARQLTQALEAVHDADVLHRDIKPSNVMLSDNGQVFLTDFSLACVESTSTDLTLTNEFLGTLRYCAPESLDGVYSRQSDIYSLGLVLLELFTLMTPFHAESRRVLLQQKLSGRVPELNAAIGTIPPQLLSILQRMTADKPESRFQSADAVLEALQRCKKHSRSVRGQRIRTAIVLLSAITLGLVTILMLKSLPKRDAKQQASAVQSPNALRKSSVATISMAPESAVLKRIVTAERLTQSADSPFLEDFRKGWLIPERAWEMPGRLPANLISLTEDGNSLAVSMPGRVLLQDDAHPGGLRPLREDRTNSVLAMSLSNQGQFVMIVCQDSGRPVRSEEDPQQSQDTISYYVETYSVPLKEWRRVGGPPFHKTRDLAYFVPGVPVDMSAVVLIPEVPEPVLWSPYTAGFWKITWPQVPAVAVAMTFEPGLSGGLIQRDGKIMTGQFVSMPDGATDEKLTVEIETGLVDCTSLHFSQQTKHIIAMSDTEVCIAESDSGKIVAAEDGLLFSTARLTFSSDGSQVAFFNAREVRLFDLTKAAWIGKTLLSENGIVLAAPLPAKNAVLIIEGSGLIRQVPVDGDSAESVVASTELSQTTPALTTAAFQEAAGRLVVSTTDGRLVSLQVP